MCPSFSNQIVPVHVESASNVGTPLTPNVSPPPPPQTTTTTEQVEKAKQMMWTLTLIMSKLLMQGFFLCRVRAQHKVDYMNPQRCFFFVKKKMCRNHLKMIISQQNYHCFFSLKNGLRSTLLHSKFQKFSGGGPPYPPPQQEGGLTPPLASLTLGLMPLA